MRCAMYGLVPPRLAIGVTATRAFSSQSVMTFAKADGAVAIMAAANSPVQIPECMLRSYGCRQFMSAIAVLTLSRSRVAVNEPEGSLIPSPDEWRRGATH